MSLYKDLDTVEGKLKDEYPFASGTAKRKIMRLQYLMKTGQDSYTKSEAKLFDEPLKTQSDFSLKGAIKDLQQSLNKPVFYTVTRPIANE